MKSTKAVSLTSRCPKFCPKKLQPLKFLLKFQMATSCMLNLYYNAIANTYYNKKASRLLAWLCELFLLKKSWWYSNYNVAIAQLYNVLKSESLHKQDKYTAVFWRIEKIKSTKAVHVCLTTKRPKFCLKNIFSNIKWFYCSTSCLFRRLTKLFEWFFVLVSWLVHVNKIRAPWIDRV